MKKEKKFTRSEAVKLIKRMIKDSDDQKIWDKCIKEGRLA